MPQQQNKLKTLLLEVEMEIELPLTESVLTLEENYEVVKAMVYDKIDAGISEVSEYYGLTWRITTVGGF